MLKTKFQNCNFFKFLMPKLQDNFADCQKSYTAVATGDH